MRDRQVEAALWRRNMRRPTPLWVFDFTLVLLTVAAFAPVAADHAPESSATVRAAHRYDERLTQYRAFRRMHAKSEKLNHEGWLDAWTEFDERGFRYEIVSERGSEYVRNKVLKTVLKREQELVADGPSRAALTDENYEFVDTAPADGVRYVMMKPRRKDVVLVDGRMVLSSDGSDVLRIEGRLAKNPSFWTGLVNIIRHFATVDGVRVPVSTETIAKVKFAGQSRMNVSYDYETINRRPVSRAARQVLSSAGSSASR
jgi:hypothetical protein